MKLLLKYLEESPVDLFDPDRYSPLLQARETTVWHLEGKPVVIQKPDGEFAELESPPRELVAGKEHHRYTIGAGPTSADAPADSHEAEKLSSLTRLESSSFDRLLGALINDAPCAIYVVCRTPSRSFPKSSVSPGDLLGAGAVSEGREGVLGKASIETLRRVLRQAVSLSGVEGTFCVVGGPLGERLGSGLEVARTSLGRAMGKAPDYATFHRALTECTLALMPTGGGDWGQNLGIYSHSPRRHEVERALLAVADEVYRVEDPYRFSFNRFPPPWDEPSVRRIGVR